MRLASQFIERRVKNARYAADAEWCEHRRRQFFRPVSIQSCGEPNRQLAGFSTSISSRSVLLLHDAALNADFVELTIPTPIRTLMKVRTEIISTEVRGERWYITEGQINNLSTFEYAKLFVATINPDPDRRISYRGPCYCPISIAPSNDDSRIIPAISRNISLTGIALLHKEPLTDQRVRIIFDGVGTDRCYERLEIKRRKELPGGWYESGGEFKGPFIEELPLFGV